MKKIKLYLYISILAASCLFYTSCNSDNDNEKPSIIGQWTTTERTVETNYKDLDKSINQYLANDLEKYTINRDFTEKQVTTTATLKNSTESSRWKRESYKIESNTLYIDDYNVNATVESEYLLSYTILTTTRKITKTDLSAIMVEIGGMDPNLLPEEISGELRMKEVR